MAENTGEQVPSVPAGQVPPEPQAAGTPPPPTNPAGEAPAEPFDQERALATIRRQREAEEAAERRAKQAEAQLKEALAQLKQHEDAKLSEQERTQRRLAEAEAERDRLREEAQRARIEAAVAAKAHVLGIVDPDAAIHLMDWASLEYDDAGRPTNTDAVLATMLEQRPYLRAQAAAPQQPAAPSTLPTNPATRTVQSGVARYRQSQLADRTFYKTHEKDILAAIREGRIDYGE